MSSIAFLASLRPFAIPQEMQDKQDQTDFKKEEEFLSFSIQPLDDYWLEETGGLFTLPYLYEAYGLEHEDFLLYLEKYMETGDVLEIYSVPNQHGFSKYKQKLLERPEPIHINVGSHTYRDSSGLYQLTHDNWVTELSHRLYLSEPSITTFVKY
ncbi:hypothetical protein [Planococcus wigleyi]|uniref:Uncharacterized protein n=1 Tax=Planococcus wigleyi TaxID=2762216 RepID=A0ABR8WF19_9BACL|nr:hypothetical protein [Planococcus wigleyi]MBD8015493.1 hypothetical protein [Planococcus wigleyi]